MQISSRTTLLAAIGLATVFNTGLAHADISSMIPGLPLTGRVVGPDGAPLAHVPVYILTKTQVTVADTVNHVPGATVNKNGQTVETDNTGSYTAQGIKPGDTVNIFVSKPGYKYISGGAVSSGYDGYQATDLVEEPPTAVLGGKVVLPSGDPAAGATVIAPGSNINLVATADPTGQFVLEGLPAGDTDVIAVSKAGYGRVQTQTGQSGLVINLKPIAPSDAPDLTRATSVLAGLYRDTAGSSYAGHDSIPFDLARYDLAGALAMASNGSQPADNVLLGLVTASTLGDVAAAAPTVNIILNTIIDPGEKALAAAAFGIALTPAHNDLAAPLLDKAKGWARQSPVEHFGGGERIAVAALAARLKNRDADRMIDDTISAMTDGAKKANRDNPAGANDIVTQFLDQYAVVIAPAGAAEIQRVVNHLSDKDPKQLTRVLPTLKACAVLVKYDVGDAQALVKKSLANGATTGMPLYGQAATAVVEQLAATDPNAALALARTVIDQGHKPIALALAAASLPASQAAPVWRDALSAALTCPQRSALSGWVASLAAQHDKALAGALFASAFKALGNQVGLVGGLSSFMFYYSQVDPAQARVEIEQEYAAAQLAMRGSEDDTPLINPTLAMTAIDVDRALQMAAGIHGPTSAPATRKIGQFLMLPSVLKHTLRFDRWIRPDAWIPGTPVE